MADKVGVFISHHHSEEEDRFTDRLVSDLEFAGADVWVDDARITSDDFIQKINEGLAGRQWLVHVMTPDALRSPWVQTEVNAALNQVRKGRMSGVIPILAKPCADADIPPLLDMLHRYDATRGYELARDGLLRALNLSALVTPAPAPVAPSPSQITKEQRQAASSRVLDMPIGEELPLSRWLRVGNAYLESQHFDAALLAYDNALAIDGNNALAWSGKAIALKQLGRHEEAGFAARCAQLGAVIARRQAEGY
jgi:tetratricopeptide (TPR) repeat protein